MKVLCQIAGVVGIAAVISSAAFLFMSREERRPAARPGAYPVPVRGVKMPQVRSTATPPVIEGSDQAEQRAIERAKSTNSLPAAQSRPQPANTSVTAASSKPAGATPKNTKDPIRDPAARVALFFVGADPLAEEYWNLAINDPSLSTTERQDLIEDLNEDGISDPKHPDIEDLPLILARLELIETLAPEAMDEVNAEAFAEAYKDLLNLALVAMGGGEPVR